MLYTDAEKMREDFEGMSRAVWRTRYAFWGGPLDGQEFMRDEVEKMCDGHTPNYSYHRQMGGLVPREDLDNQPTVNGYLGPMWDGIRCVMKDGTVKHDFEVIDQTKVKERYAVLRYETQEVYNELSR